MSVQVGSGLQIHPWAHDGQPSSTDTKAGAHEGRRGESQPRTSLSTRCGGVTLVGQETPAGQSSHKDTSMARAVGVDLRTTNSVCAAVDEVGRR